MSYNKAAIIFGASEYSRAPDLSIIQMGKCARGFTDYLKNTFKDIDILDLFDKDITTREEIIDAINDFCNQQSLPGDIIIFYVGHGILL